MGSIPKTSNNNSFQKLQKTVFYSYLCPFCPKLDQLEHLRFHKILHSRKKKKNNNNNKKKLSMQTDGWAKLILWDYCAMYRSKKGLEYLENLMKLLQQRKFSEIDWLNWIWAECWKWSKFCRESFTSISFFSHFQWTIKEGKLAQVVDYGCKLIIIVFCIRLSLV